ncbi:MAG: HAD-IIB family hydrolase [Bradymonadales bacterium]|nr:HAD-IIB family hydrolase [Bradymonadales bacterium]
MSLIPIAKMPAEVCRAIEVIFTDIDDTLTVDGRLPAVAFQAMWQAHEAGIRVIPVTGRPAGWCDLIARLWPVAAVVGENGALSFALIDRRMRRLYADRPTDAGQRLQQIGQRVLAEVPGCKISADQAYREFDLAIDYAEEVERLDEAAVDRIAQIATEQGATAKVSSIHVNAWFGEFTKLSMCRRCYPEWFGVELDPRRATFVGDSPNDEPMFEFFPQAVGVANVRELAHRMRALPAYVTERRGGFGFAELVSTLLSRR